MIEYSFTGRKLAVFTWHGCVLEISFLSGSELVYAVNYIGYETPMQSYLNVHMALEQVRDAVRQSATESGPRVLIVGQADSGKTTLSKILVNYAAKQSRRPIFIDIDPTQGSISLPGTVGAMAVTRFLDCEDEFSAPTTLMGTTPIVYYYGFTEPLERPKLYCAIVSKMASVINTKMQDPELNASGFIIDTPSQFAEPAGFDLLKDAIQSFQVNIVLVIGHERLFSDLKAHFGDKSDVSVMKLNKSGGAVTRNRDIRRKMQMQRIAEYFYGSHKTEMTPFSQTISFSDVAIRKVDEGTLAPSSALPLGTERKSQDNKYTKVEPGDILLHSVLAVTHALLPGAPDANGVLTKIYSPEEETLALLESNIAGFIYVSEVMTEKRKMTVLAPTPGKLPKTFLMMATLKWLDSYGIPNFRFAGVLGNDVSSLFFPGNLFSMYCPGLTPPQAGWDPLVNRPRSDANNYAHVGIDPKTGRQKLYLEFMNKYARARVGYSLDYIAKVSSTERRLIVIHDNVYDVSGYFNANSRFFGSLVEQLFGNFYGRDATAQWAQIQRVDPNAPQYINCLNNMFYIGTVDHRNDFRCQFSNYILLASSVFIVAIIGFKFLAALRCGSARDPEYHDKFVICQVPCYTEGAESLSKTLDSLSVMQYDDKRKLLFIIADGMVVGSGNDKPTPQIVLDLLGVDPASIEDTEAMSFLSLGEGDMQHNMAKVYSGLYQVQGHAVPFVVVVKVGKPSERVKPGNRGKRDSQLILMRFLSQVHFNAEMSPLELEIFHHMKNIIGVHPAFYEYVLMVDADTEVMPDSLNKLVSTMMHDSKIMGLCGETLLSNEKDSWITMIQVYEYFISHHLSKAFESLFGSVTCLPGCFSMYRIRAPTKPIPLLVAPGIIADYAENTVNTLHLKNLLQLGEDRYLTTLMMKHFPNMKTCFNPDAQCRTNAPDRWKVLLSQRRRWINSTVHNLVELLSLEQLCGFCCFSMRFIVFIDLFSTVVQPAGVLYIGYLIYTLITSPDVFPTISIVMLAAIYGFQIIIFIFKRQWAQIGWMIIYLLAMPVFGFYIPLYSFWHFDDFSWGNTRVAVGDQSGAGDGHGGGRTKQAVKQFDPKSIPMRRWADTEFDKWEGQSHISHESRSTAQMRAGSVSAANATMSTRPIWQQPRGLKVAIPEPAARASGAVPGAASNRGTNEYGSPTSTHASSHNRNDYAATANPTAGLRSRVPPMPSAQQTQQASQHSAPSSIHAAGSTAMHRQRSAESIPDSEIIALLRNILSTTDLTVTTKRQVRDRVSQQLGVDLTPRREQIGLWMDQIIRGKL
eukprot:jgi/Hompol1/6695/HPOL_000415-RA